MLRRQTDELCLQSGETLALARWGFECPDAHCGLAFQRKETLETDYGYPIERV